MSARCGVPWLATGAATQARVARRCDHTRGSIFSRQSGAGAGAHSQPAHRYSPSCVLYEFSELSELLQLIGDRLLFLCDWVLELFLTPDPWLPLDSHHLEVACEVLAAEARRGGRAPA